MTERDIFTAALREPDPAARAAHLDRACAGDRALRERVESLLLRHDELGDFLEEPAGDVGATGAYTPAPDSGGGPDSREVLGTVVGRYKPLELIGEGGMGTVWMAQQTEPVKRRVALKLIKPGMDSRVVLARFEAERQALALMDHPNIAKVLDAGETPDGRPYFVMELVKGVPITRFCDDRHLPPRQRLELFVPVCQAIQHAHQKGVIHRDLKPSNVLVALYDDKPVPKVIDFGVAKAAGQPLTDRTLVTGFGAVVGTPEYMSPEQAGFNQLDVDTRSDIYSLGVLLYELLAGSPPFSSKELEHAGVLEMLRVIREEEPSRPSTKLSTAEGLPTLAANRGTEPAKLTRLVRGELDWIVMKALEKDRARRYETANGLAMDLQRYLADEPILACPPSAGYRLRKFARRNRRPLGTAAVVAVAVLLAVGALSWTLKDRAAREAEAGRQRAATEQAFGQAVDHADKARAELHAVLRRPGGTQELLNQPGRWEVYLTTAQAEGRRAEALAAGLGADASDRAREAAQGLAADEAEYRLALRLEKIRLDAATWVGSGFDYDTALREYPRAFAEAGVDIDRGPEAAARVAGSPIREQLVAALDHWVSLLALMRGPPEQVARLLAVARRADPDPWRDRVRGPALWMNKDALPALADQVRDDHDRFRRLTPSLLSLVGQLLRDEAAALAWLRRAQLLYPADFWLNFSLAARLRGDRGRLLEAAGFYRAALAVRPQSTAVLNNLGSIFNELEDYPAATEVFRQAVAIDPRFARGWRNLGVVRNAQGDLPGAVAAMKNAIAIDPKESGAWSSLGQVLLKQKDLRGAADALEKAVAVDPKDATAWTFLGSVLYDQKDLAGAERALRNALALAADANSAITWTNLGNVLDDQKRGAEAVEAYRKALDLDPRSAPAWYNLGLALSRQKDAAGALDAFRKAVANDPGHADAWAHLGAALQDRKDLPGSADAFKKVVAIRPRSAHDWTNLGNVLRERKDLAGAADAFEKAVNADPGYATAWSSLGIVRLLQNNPSGAADALKKAVAIDPQLAPAWDNLGVALLALKDPAGAADALKKALAINPRKDGAWNNLGLALRGLKDLPGAADAHRKALAIAPRNALAWNNLGTVLWEQNDLNEAIVCFRKAVEIDPALAAAQSNLASTLARAGRTADAIAAYRTVVERWPLSAEPHNDLARLLATAPEAELRDPARAVALAKKAVRLDAKNAAYANTLGVAHYRAGDWRAAVDALGKATALRPGGHGADWIVLAMAHWRLGEKEQAREWYGRAAEWIDRHQPKNEELRRFRAEAAELLGVEGQKN